MSEKLPASSTAHSPKFGVPNNKKSKPTSKITPLMKHLLEKVERKKAEQAREEINDGTS